MGGGGGGNATPSGAPGGLGPNGAGAPGLGTPGTAGGNVVGGTGGTCNPTYLQGFGGAGGPGGRGGNNGGFGGYGIYNTGTIATLINSQGGTSLNYSNNITNFGPLSYSGTVPDNYKIVIISSTRYGQLSYTGSSPTINFDISSISNLSNLSAGIYINVLTNITPSNKSGNFKGYPWSLVQNGSSYNLVILQATCFKEGSQILTNKGYLPIENLRKGDLVKTLKNDYLPIVMIGKSLIYNYGDSNRIKNRLYILSKDKYDELTEDLVLTGCHSILMDWLTKEQEDATLANYGEFKITDGKVRLETYLDPKADPYPEEGTFTIYHLALENENYFHNYGIWANGLLVETCSKRYLKELSHMELIE